jgi:NAD(P)-dependent dehydrogenase (short-subunit alcohol dehydrogenase family)
LVTKYFLALPLKSSKPDIVAMISSAGVIGHQSSDAHAAFCSAKAAQAGFVDILPKRLRPHGSA